MAATPPPPKRIRTPPTPLHGPRFDIYEPYSPRRSSRIASRAGANASYSGNSNTSHTPNRSWNSSSSSSAAINSARNSSQTFSPPVSPVSPIERTNTRARRPGLDALTPRKQQQVRVQVDHDSDPDLAGQASQVVKSGLPTTLLGAGMLPTPSKTPQKRAAPAELVHSTARVLFPGRTAKVEDAMPATRKSKASRRAARFSLDGFADDGDDEAGNIPIYTDSKERVPDLDEGEENPFVTKLRGKSRASAATKQTVETHKRGRKRAELIEEEVEMEKKVKDDEGIIYVFRGRKVYRRFENASADATAAESDTADDPLSINSRIKRKAGAAATEQRFTRHTIKPKLLFPNAEQQKEREERARLEEEEAVTDIEVPPTEETGKVHLDVEADDAAEEELTTPVKTRFGPVTPPSSSKAKKKGSVKARKIAVHVDDDAAMAVVDEVEAVDAVDAADADALTPNPGASSEQSGVSVPRTRATKVSPFTTWQRTKPGMSTKSSSKGTKREREVDASDVGGGASGKRVRSGTIG